MTEPPGESLHNSSQMASTPAGNPASSTAPDMATTDASTAVTPSEQSSEQQLRSELHNNAAREADLQGRLAEQVQTSQPQQNMVKPGLNMSFEETSNPGIKIKAEVTSPNPSDETFADGERTITGPQRQILDVSSAPLQKTGQVTANNSIADGYQIKEEDTDSEELTSHLNMTAPTTPAPARQLNAKQRRQQQRPQHHGPNSRVHKRQHLTQQTVRASPNPRRTKCNNCRKYGHTQHECRKPHRARQNSNAVGQETAAEFQMRGPQQVGFTLPQGAHPHQQYVEWSSPYLRAEMAQGQRPSPASQYEMFQDPRSEYGQGYHPQPRPGFGFDPPRRGEQFGPQPTNVVHRGPFYEPTWDRNERSLPFRPPVGEPTYNSREPNHGYRAPSLGPSYGHNIPTHPGQVYANRPMLSEPPRPWPTERHMYREYHDHGAHLFGTPVSSNDYRGPGPNSSEYGYQGRDGPPIAGHPYHDGYQPRVNGLAYPRNPNGYGNWGNPPTWWQGGMGRR